ncbi:MAG: antitermination protein NusG [Planctomycetota bacterium]|jgi:transcription antitermination factor NusG|nr:antitermination protein NusG [Planctomycetota bacterium]
MPILPQQRDMYPDDLLSDGAAAVATDTRDGANTKWVVFYTLSRREKDLMRRLESVEIPFYGPLIRRRLPATRGQPRVSYVSLFPGYVFARVDDEQRRTALGTNTIARWLPVVDEHKLVNDLCSLRQLIASNRPLTPEARLDAGHVVRVRSGPLAGLEGIVVKRRGGVRLVVMVQFLNQGASIELEDVDLELI